MREEKEPKYPAEFIIQSHFRNIPIKDIPPEVVREFDDFLIYHAMKDYSE